MHSSRAQNTLGCCKSQIVKCLLDDWHRLGWRQLREFKTSFKTNLIFVFQEIAIDSEEIRERQFPTLRRFTGAEVHTVKLLYYNLSPVWAFKRISLLCHSKALISSVQFWPLTFLYNCPSKVRKFWNRPKFSPRETTDRRRSIQRWPDFIQIPPENTTKSSGICMKTGHSAVQRRSTKKVPRSYSHWNFEGEFWTTWLDFEHVVAF